MPKTAPRFSVYVKCSQPGMNSIGSAKRRWLNASTFVHRSIARPIAIVSRNRDSAAGERKLSVEGPGIVVAADSSGAGDEKQRPVRPVTIQSARPVKLIRFAID